MPGPSHAGAWPCRAGHAGDWPCRGLVGAGTGDTSRAARAGMGTPESLHQNRVQQNRVHQEMARTKRPERSTTTRVAGRRGTDMTAQLSSGASGRGRTLTGEDRSPPAVSNPPQSAPPALRRDARTERGWPSGRSRHARPSHLTRRSHLDPAASHPTRRSSHGRVGGPCGPSGAGLGPVVGAGGPAAGRPPDVDLWHHGDADLEPACSGAARPGGQRPAAAAAGVAAGAAARGAGRAGRVSPAGRGRRGGGPAARA